MTPIPQPPTPKPFQPTHWAAHWLTHLTPNPRVTLFITLLIASTSHGAHAATAYVDTPGYRLNVRSGPGVDYSWVSVLYDGDRVETTGQTRNGWVELVDGTWVAGNLIRPGNTAPPPLTATVNTPNDYRLNMREGPGTHYPWVGVLNHGALAQLTGQIQNGWVQLTDNAWVAGNLLNPIYGGLMASQAFHQQSSSPNNREDKPPAPIQNIPPEVPPSQPSYPSDLSLLPGSQGTAVVDLQTRLKLLGYLPTNFEPTGYYDSTTQQAVASFQQNHYFEASGVANTRTILALYNNNVSAPLLPNYVEGKLVELNAEGGTIEVRDAPSLKALIIRQVANGTLVRLTDQVQDDWVQLKEGGWVLRYWAIPPQL